MSIFQYSWLYKSLGYKSYTSFAISQNPNPKLLSSSKLRALLSFWVVLSHLFIPWIFPPIASSPADDSLIPLLRPSHNAGRNARAEPNHMAEWQGMGLKA